MSATFDPYLQWLGIRDPQRPPNHYRLLGVELFENDPEVLANAADRQMAHVRTFQVGKHAAESQRLLNELAAAKLALLNPEKKAEYDAWLWEQLSAMQAQGVLQPGASYLGYSGYAVPGGPVVSPPGAAFPASSGSSLAPQPARGETGADGPTLSSGPIRTWLVISVFTAMVVVLLGLVFAMFRLRGLREEEAANELAVADVLATVQATDAANKGPSAEKARATAKPAEGAAVPRLKPAEAPSAPAKVSAPAAPPTPQPSAKPAPKPEPPDDLLAGPPDPRPTAELIQAAREAMRNREMAAARRLLAWAEKNATAKDRAECDRLREAFDPLDTFWRLVRRSMASLEPGEKLALPGAKPLTVVQATEDLLVVGLGNQQEKFTVKDLPLVLALLLAERSLSDRSMVLVPKIAFLTFDARGDRTLAEKLCREAKSRGLPCEALLAELSQAGQQQPKPAAAPGSKLPVPSEAHQAEARREIREVFRDAFAAAQKPAEKGALAERLLSQAVETKDNPSARYILLVEARDLAVAAGNAAALRKAIQELANSYEIDAVAEMTKTLRGASQAVLPTGIYRELGLEAMKQSQEATTAEQYDQAGTMAQIAHTLALKGRDAATARQAKAFVDELPELKAQLERSQKAARLLAENPLDPEANLVQGKYFCFLKNRWAQGLPLLAKGSDPALKAAAEAELSAANSAPDPTVMVKLGDHWVEAAKSVDPRTARHVLARAVTWYKRALPALKGFTRARVERQIEQYDETPREPRKQ